jgi:hypothetical protein
MPRQPKKPKPPAPRGAVGAMAASLARRKAAREPRVVLTEPGGHPRTLAADDPAAGPLLEAADRLISAAQRRSGA